MPELSPGGRMPFFNQKRVWFMSLEVQSVANSAEPVVSSESASRPSRHKSEAAANSTRRKPKLGSRMTMWIRRIHLFSGLFMLPWVLLYGFTALLFNHPTYMRGSDTSIDSFHVPLAEADLNSELTSQILSAIQEQRPDISLKLVSDGASSFTRQAVASYETEELDVSVVLDLNSGHGYVRKSEKRSNPNSDNPSAEKGESLATGLPLEVESSFDQQMTSAMRRTLEPMGVETGRLRLRSIPTFEFEGWVDGEKKRFRFAQQRRRREESNSGATGVFRGKLSVVGENPRELSARSFLLRLHMAHGYPVERNARWFWAICVDAMFASMCFWGLSGVVMWWQIKRTRKLGLILLLLSALAATSLAIGMHWQLVNG